MNPDPTGIKSSIYLGNSNSSLSQTLCSRLHDILVTLQLCCLWIRELENGNGERVICLVRKVMEGGREKELYLDQGRADQRKGERPKTK